MAGLGEAEFRSLEAALRRRLETWTGGPMGREFLVLDAPFPIAAGLSEKLIDPGANAAPGADPGAGQLAYFFALDRLANPVLRPIEGTGRVTADATRLSDVYRQVLDGAGPRDDGEDEGWRLLYDEGEDGRRTPTPLYETYRALRGRVREIEAALHGLEAEEPRSDALIRAKRDELEDARADLAVSGRAEAVEAVLAAIAEDDDRRVTWRRARDDYWDGTLRHAETTIDFPVTRCRPVPRDNWMRIDLAFDDSDAGALLGQGETVRRIEAEAFPLFMDRSGWYDHGVLTGQPWDWHPNGAGRVLSDGKGRGEMPYLPAGAVLLRDIRITVRMPFEAPGAPEPGAPPPPPKLVPTLGKMTMPLRIERVDGRAVAAARIAEARPAAAFELKAGGLSVLQRKAIAASAVSVRDLEAELRTLTVAPRIEPAVPRTGRLEAAAIQARPRVAVVSQLKVRPRSAMVSGPAARSAPAVRGPMVSKPAAVATPAPKPAALTLATRRFADGAWRPEAMTVKARPETARGQPVRTLRTDAGGRLSTALPAGRWRLEAKGVGPEAVSAPAIVQLVPGGSAGATVSVAPRWTEVELSACGPGEGFMLFGYLADPYPALPSPP